MVTRNTKGERNNINASPSAKGKSKAADEAMEEEEEEEEDDDVGSGEEEEEEEVRHASSLVWCRDSTRLPLIQVFENMNSVTYI
jgi:hypothetical protein